jgi:hypothetical protein
MTKQEQRVLAAGFIRLEDTLSRTEDALQNGSVEQALSELQETQHAIAAMRPAEIDVAQAATALGVSKPTVRAWARRGLIDVVREQPMLLDFASVVDLRRDLERLREISGSEKRWQSLLAAAADQRELAQDGAREGFAEVVAGNTEPLIRT